MVRKVHLLNRGGRSALHIVKHFVLHEYTLEQARYVHGNGAKGNRKVAKDKNKIQHSNTAITLVAHLGIWL